MKNLIYQYWDGEIKESCQAGSANMKAYAERVGADYLFENNPRFANSFGWKLSEKSKAHFGALKPVFCQEFDTYDHILYVDTDVFVVDGVTESIFDCFSGEIGMCDEPEQPELRKISLAKITTETDEQWAAAVEKIYSIAVPRNAAGLVRCYNSGVVLWSRSGRQRARQEFKPFDQHVRDMKSHGLRGYYLNDQIYLNTMAAVTGIQLQELDNNWNSYVHGFADRINPRRRILDWRTPQTKFVHCMFSGADDMTGPQLWRYVNLPKDQLNYDL